MTDTAASPGSVIQVRQTPLAELRPHPRNPRRISDARLAQLARALEADPAMLWARPLIALPDGTVIAGNQRLAAARLLGWSAAPVATVDLDAERAAMWALRDNQPYGEWEPGALGELLGELAAAGANLELAGFPEEELAALLDSLTPPPGLVEPDAVPELPAEAVSQPGEVFQLGRHRLVCGDATDPAVYELLGLERAALLVTDPPYGLDYRSRGRQMAHERGDAPAPPRLANDALGEDGTRLLVRDALAAALPALVPGGPFYLFSPGGPLALPFRLALADVGLEPRVELAWVKDRHVFGRQDYHWRHEVLLYGWRSGAAHPWHGGRDQDTVLEYPRPARSDEHPTIKPVELVERLLRNSSARGDTVLDPFAGSGTTLVAAERLGRTAALVELDPRYCDVIRRRFAAFTGAEELAP